MARRHKIIQDQVHTNRVVKPRHEGVNIYQINKAPQTYWQEAFARASASKNWQDLLELGKQRLSEKDYALAITCLIESRHYNHYEPVTHKYLADAYCGQAEQLKQANDSRATVYYQKAQMSYQAALDAAKTRKDAHFLAEFRQDIDNMLEDLEGRL